MAARRAAKANRRKAIVAQKRKAEAVNGTLAGQVARAVALPIRQCLCTKNMFEVGMGSLILARGSTVGPVVVGAFLLDSFALGVKDVMLQTMEGAELTAYLDMVSDATPVVPVDPSYARKLLHDLVQWSCALGFRPHRDFAAVERLFGTVDPHACQTEFEFGQDGKPLYVSGPMEISSVTRRLVEQLSETLEPDDFDYTIEM